MMNPFPQCPRELEPLLHDLVDPTGAVDYEQLERVLRDSPAARAYYLRYIQLHAELQLLADSPLTSPLSAADPTDDMPVVRLRSFWQSLFQPKFSHAAITALLMISAGLAVLAIVKVPALNPPRPAVAEAVSPVAQLSATHQCVWVGDPPSSRAWFQAGRELALRSGQAELQFTDGAKVVISGPARVRIDSAGSCTLASGDAIAEAPESAGGFTIHTPTAVVVDLGTRFAVSVGETGLTEVHVFQGQVAVQPGGDQDEGQQAGVRRLEAGDALQIDHTYTFRAIACAPRRFIRRTPNVAHVTAHQSSGLIGSGHRVAMGGNPRGVRRIGASSEQDTALASILLFRLPQVDDPADIETARLAFTYRSTDGNPDFAVDLYGLGFVTDANVDAEWLYEGPADPRSPADYATGQGDQPVARIAAEIMSPSTNPGRIVIQSPELTSFIAAQYAAGAAPGDLVVLRLNASSPTASITRMTGYNIVHAPAIVGRTLPHEVPALSIFTGQDSTE